jgi:hypothetical protein
VGQITTPPTQGITVNPTDRQSGPSAGGGATGNNSIFLGANAGLNSTISNFIVIGHGSGDGGITDNANLGGSVIVGVGSAEHVTVGVGNQQPLVIIGPNDLVNYTSPVDSTTIVGSNILNGTNGGFGSSMSENVLIGNTLFPAADIHPLMSGNIIIGAQIASGAIAGNQSIPTNTVMIGYQMFTGGFTSYANSVLIGAGMGFSGANGSSISTTVAIGNSITIPDGCSGDVVIGSGAAYNGSNTGSINNTIIGEAATFSGNQNVAIGGLASIPDIAADAARGFVCIGFGAGTTVPATGGALNGLLVIESNVGAGVQTLLYGAFGTGNLIIGNSTNATNRDFAGTTSTNIVKLLNGTIGNANPIGGGYFYVAAGVLHWVDTAGNDSQLSENVQGQLASSALHAFTNNAAANAGTLTNAPAIGNPTKWIPINDAGTIRNIPAW